MVNVYIHTVPNGKIYIGQSENAARRWSDGKGYIYNDEFYSDIKKYGWNNITHEILCECVTRQEAEEYERLFIVFLDSENSEKGYNKTNIVSDLMKKYKDRKVYVECKYEVVDDNEEFNPFMKYDIPTSEGARLIEE